MGKIDIRARLSDLHTDIAVGFAYDKISVGAYEGLRRQIQRAYMLLNEETADKAFGALVRVQADYEKALR